MADRKPTRRRYLFAVGAVGVAGLAGCRSLGDGDDNSGEETTAGRGSPGDKTPTEDGVDDGKENTPDESGSTSSITPQWTYETGGEVQSSPAVVDDTLYVGSLDTTVYALDAATGDEQWRFQTGKEVESSPTVVDGTLYVGSRDNTLYAVSEQ